MSDAAPITDIIFYLLIGGCASTVYVNVWYVVWAVALQDGKGMVYALTAGTFWPVYLLVKLINGNT